MHWAEPAWFFLLVFTPLPWLWERTRPRMTWSTLTPFASVGSRRAIFLNALPTLLLSLSIGFMSVALARPRIVGGSTRISGQGVAIVIVIDRSPSMNADDFVDDLGHHTRLETAKQTVDRFIAGRGDDPVGIVAFARYPDLTCPPTLDHEFARQSVRALKTAVGEEDGTNIGDATAVGIDALRGVDVQSRVLILLSDGRNEPNLPKPLDPHAAARLAARMGMTVHTIAVGSAGGLVRDEDPASKLPVVSDVGGSDLTLLGDLARLGGGRAFRATDPQTLSAVFDVIDAMATSPVQGTILTRYDERFAPWALAAAACLAASKLLRRNLAFRLP